MPISQPNSALARADRHVLNARDALERKDYAATLRSINGALGALSYAGTAQSKLIDACNGAAKSMAKMRQGTFIWARTECAAAVDAAENPTLPQVD